MNRTENIKRFLTAKTHPDLAELYTPDMECQVNVGQDGGDKIGGEYEGRTWHGWSDGVTTWKAFRIPWNANTVPEFRDSPIGFDLAAHVEGIGMTGWDFRAKVSRWVAFDFDAIIGHSAKHSKGLTQEQLDVIREKASAVPWIEIRRSTSGAGLHFYVKINPPVATANHNEHAALGRSILSKLAGLTGTDFENKVDVCGQNMWVWHRKMNAENRGLELIKEGVPLDTVPSNWRDNIAVVRGIRSRSLPRFVEEFTSDNSTEKSFLELSGQTTKVPLDSEHTKLIEFLGGSNSSWNADFHMLQTHTFLLKNAHRELGLKGIYDTISEGSDLNTNNCYCFPIRRGAWSVRRHGKGVGEHPTWDQDGKGWTRCYFNTEPDLSISAKSLGGIESPTKGFVFKEAALAKEAAERLGAVVPPLAPSLQNRPATIKEHRDGRILINIDAKDTGANADMPGWLNEKGSWQRLFNISSKASVEPDVLSYDELIRHVVTSDNEDCGWLLYSDNVWRQEPMAHLKPAMKSLGIGTKEMDSILGAAILRAWKLVNQPFKPEFPGNREWNRDAAQFAIVPSEDIDNLNYPTWQKILEHCGCGLDDVLANHPWAKSNGIVKGSDYLKIWCASLFKEPTQPLPYLFLYSTTQNTGKSTFHEALSLLLTKGYQRADSALINQHGFNGELVNAIICVIEEVDLGKSKIAANRVKDWVTAKDLAIHPKGATPYHIPNTTHWIQCANDIKFCPTFPGDTRITMIQVEPLDPVEMVPKKTLTLKLQDEAGAFLAALLRTEIPPSNDRLNVPVIVTEAKLAAERFNRSHIEEFLAEHVYRVDGELVEVDVLYEAFMQFLDADERPNYSKNKFARELTGDVIRGRSRITNNRAYGNISLKPRVGPKKPKLVVFTNESGTTYLQPENYE